ncbi:hypothetical protein KUL156_42850 [Alteromonas sp. KUL156]|uniref:Uncharacterized protein n=1 Tax=Tenacibaculum sp. Pbs-1 TaxID=3238748 RepID=A0AB33KWN5_9FLAO|nr:hypothetical protein KUL154_54170 [Alteromonas sp. KUL154]GFE01693.1 hypothetical protein KUL156_42850 [Alteromonas sp. KUL156]
MGILVELVLNAFILPDISGYIYPILTPNIIATKIHNVKFLSKKLNFFVNIFYRFIIILQYYD